MARAPRANSRLSQTGNSNRRNHTEEGASSSAAAPGDASNMDVDPHTGQSDEEEEEELRHKKPGSGSQAQAPNAPGDDGRPLRAPATPGPEPGPAPPLAAPVAPPTAPIAPPAAPVAPTAVPPAQPAPPTGQAQAPADAAAGAPTGPATGPPGEAGATNGLGTPPGSDEGEEAPQHPFDRLYYSDTYWMSRVTRNDHMNPHLQMSSHGSGEVNHGGRSGPHGRDYRADPNVGLPEQRGDIPRKASPRQGPRPSFRRPVAAYTHASPERTARVPPMATDLRVLEGRPAICLLRYGIRPVL
ncbi:hypothetical protein HGRIS_014530 [Hohenbuehelia grisea]|uniref:Uncharacterized protein n=1 Tax=Hohenbuehelia grisea TaxID=104357 RepID=A0ABR3JUC9_9AGAR